MAICRKCGREFHNSLWDRLFRRNDLCPECRRRRDEGLKLLNLKLKDFGSDGYLDQEEERQIAKIMREYDLDDTDLGQLKGKLEDLRSRTRAENVRRLMAKLEEIGQDNYVDDSELRELYDLADSLGVSLYEEEKVASTLRRLLRLTEIQNGMLPVVYDVDLILKPREVCHYAYPVDLVEERSHTHYVGSHQGVTIRLAKGISYRIGGFHGQRITVTSREIVDSGELYVTNQRVVYVGERKNYVYPLGKLVTIHKYGNAIRFQKENEKRPKYFMIDDEFVIEEIALIVYTLLRKRAEG